MLAAIPDAGFRETARDFMVNRLFRRDYWVRGARRMTAADRAERLRAVRVVLATPAANVKFKVIGALGEANLHEDVYRPILDALADHRPRSLGELEATLAPHGTTLVRIVEAVMILAGAGNLHPAQSDEAIAHARAGAILLNTRLCALARYAEDVGCLASPVTGGGFPVRRIDQLFLLARSLGHAGDQALAAFAADVLQAQGQRIMQGGQPVLDNAQQLDMLRGQAQSFTNQRLPVLVAMGVTV